MRRMTRASDETSRDTAVLEEPADDETGDEERFIQHEMESLGHGCYWRHVKDLDRYEW